MRRTNPGGANRTKEEKTERKQKLNIIEKVADKNIRLKE